MSGSPPFARGRRAEASEQAPSAARGGAIGARLDRTPGGAAPVGSAPLRSRSTAGFTLIEVLIALAIMAVGTTAAIGLFTAATAMHKRAIDETTAALVADAALAEARGLVTLGFEVKSLGTARAATADAPPVFYLRRNVVDPTYPGYVADTLLTPVGTLDPDEADAFIAEVRVRWKTTDRALGADFRTIVLRRVTLRDLR